jgi:hypothetical protein
MKKKTLQQFSVTTVTVPSTSPARLFQRSDFTILIVYGLINDVQIGPNTISDDK